MIFCSFSPSLKRHQFGGSAGILRCGKGTTYEGGQRVPAMFSFKGKIVPGKSHGLASTLDILPTILSITGSKTTPMTHGYDLSPHLFGSEKSPRKHFAFYPSSPSKSRGLYALRYKQYKAHFYTQGSALSDKQNYDEACHQLAVEKHDPALMFDLNQDPGERYPIDPHSDLYKEIIGEINLVKDQVESKVTWAESEVAKGTSRGVTPCCNPIGPRCGDYPSCCDCQKNYDPFEIPTILRV